MRPQLEPSRSVVGTPRIDDAAAIAIPVEGMDEARECRGTQVIAIRSYDPERLPSLSLADDNLSLKFNRIKCLTHRLNGGTICLFFISPANPPSGRKRCSFRYANKF